MTDGATMPAFSDERLIDAAGAVGADRPEQRPLLVAAAAGRLEVVVDAPPSPRTELFAGVERWIGSIKLYRLWLKRRSSCLSPFLGAYGLQDAPPRSGQPKHDVLKQHPEEPEREASRCLVGAAVLVCVCGMI